MSALTVAEVDLDEVRLPSQRTIELGVAPRALPWTKHLVDQVLAAIMLILLLPLFTALSLAVLLSGPGGVLYRQRRVGLGGGEFTILKFRTMRRDGHTQREQLRAQDNGNGMLFKIHADPRVTGVGRFLRRWSLDELPQLINVLRGEMSLVGPRPALPEEVARYSALARRRLEVKPGLTGLWQVSGRSDLSWEESVRLDLEYVARANLALDARILAKTVTAVASGRGAY